MNQENQETLVGTQSNSDRGTGLFSLLLTVHCPILVVDSDYLSPQMEAMSMLAVKQWTIQKQS